MDSQTSRRPQFLAAVSVNVLSFVYGLAIGWTPTMQPLLQANYTGTNETSPLGVNADPLTNDDISWAVGALNAAGMLSTPMHGYCNKVLGKKKALILSALSFITSFSILAGANDKTYIFIARVLGGIGAGGVCVTAPTYASEIAQDSIRGMLASFLNLFIGIGILVGYIVGSYAGYMGTTLFCLFWSVFYLFLMLWVPESPVYLLQEDKDKEAFQALMKLRGNQQTLAEQEMTRLTARVKEMKSNASGAMSLRDMLQDLPTRKALIIGLVVVTLQQLSGISAVLNYVVAIFNASGSELPSSLSSIIIGVLQFIGGLLGTILMDCAGRRLLLLISNIGMTLTLIPLSYFYYLQSSGEDPIVLQSIGWLPVTSLSLFVVIFSIGMGPVPFVLVSELFKTEAKSVGATVCIMHCWFCVFLIVTFFNSLSNAFGIETCFMLFAISCACGAVFIYLYVVETKGKSLEQIVEELSCTKSSGVSSTSSIEYTGKKEPSY